MQNSARFGKPDSRSIRPSAHAQRTGRCQTHRPQLGARLFPRSCFCPGARRSEETKHFSDEAMAFPVIPSRVDKVRSPPCFDLGPSGRGDDVDVDDDKRDLDN
jgi:hypothetical protein